MTTNIEINNVKNIYDNIATDFSDKRFETWEWIKTFLNKLPNNSRILDIGCGNGRNMLDPRHTFVGIDNCATFVNICKNRGLNVVYSDMAELPFEDNSFDAIISIASFHHLSSIERRIKCLEEMKRVISHNGKILLSVWSKNQSHNNKKKFRYGDNYVPWKNIDGSVKGIRYYYIFNNTTLKTLLKKHFVIKKWYWDYGNEIIELINFENDIIFKDIKI